MFHPNFESAAICKFAVKMIQGIEKLTTMVNILFYVFLKKKKNFTCKYRFKSDYGNVVLGCGLWKIDFHDKE